MGLNYIFLSNESIKKLSEDLSREVKSTPFDVLVAIPEGGIHFAEILARDIGYKGEIIHLDNIAGYAKDLKGKKILLCDDTVRTGQTLKNAVNNLLVRGLNDITIVALSVRCGAEVIPNIYAFEINNKDVLILPWKSFPIRRYPGGIIYTLNRESLNAICNDSNYTSTGGILSVCRPTKIKDYALRGYGINRDGMICGIVRYWESEDEIIVEDILPLGEDSEEIYKTLWKSLMNTAYFHGKERLVNCIPKAEAQSILGIYPEFKDGGTYRDKTGQAFTEIQFVAGR
ncbi:MAG: phosphoribosyltransferase [Candidatus Altiarchaeia archaeon]